MQLRDIFQRVQSLYSKGVQSQNSRLSNRHIYNKLLTVRSKLLYQQLSKRQKISDFNFTVLNCIELIDVDSSLCPCLPSLGCKVVRTKYPLPKPMSSFDNHVIEYIYNMDNTIRYSETNRIEYNTSKHNKFTSNTTKYIIENGYVYIYGSSISKAINIKLLLDNPIEKYEIPSLCSDLGIMKDNCLTFDTLNFDIDNFLLEDLIQITVQELVESMLKIPQDIRKNQVDDRESI